MAVGLGQTLVMGREIQRVVGGLWLRIALE